jgi:sulfite exporter TauE/SafE
MVTYSIFGLVFGFLGKGIAVAGLQRFASIFLGVTILIYYVVPSSIKGKLSATMLYKLISNFIKKAFSKLTESGSSYSLFIFGIINGFLPCGFVYVALAGALTTGEIVSGALFMALFGLGTAPIMFVTSLVGKFFNLSLRKKINRLVPFFAIALAIIFILRGLNLGIPYLSPPEEKLQPKSKMINGYHN